MMSGFLSSTLIKMRGECVNVCACVQRAEWSSKSGLAVGADVFWRKREREREREREACRRRGLSRWLERGLSQSHFSCYCCCCSTKRERECGRACRECGSASFLSACVRVLSLCCPFVRIHGHQECSFEEGSLSCVGTRLW